MTRPDLKPGFNGWQASDPTPQEKSDGTVKNTRRIHRVPVDKTSSNIDLMSPSGVYCCGPVPVKAIKEGELTFNYDAVFVFAEVNADVLTFKKEKDGSTSRVTTTSLVGQKISTKSVGSDAREDVTHLYKYPEGRFKKNSAPITDAP